MDKINTIAPGDSGPVGGNKINSNFIEVVKILFGGTIWSGNVQEDLLVKLQDLKTTDKTSFVNALNELYERATAVDDSQTDSLFKTWSVTKLKSFFVDHTELSAAIAALVASSPETLDTLEELANALGDDPNFATTVSTALGNRLRVDVSDQNLSSQQKTNATTNLGLDKSFIDALNVDADTLDGLNSTDFLKVANNLSDLNDASTSRDNLGINKTNIDALGINATTLNNISANSYAWAETYLQNYRSRVLDNGATYFPNSASVGLALNKELNIQNKASIYLSASATNVGTLPVIKGLDLDFVRNDEATYVDEDGIIQTAPINVPRIDFSDNGTGALLLEPQSTNLITFSEDFTDASWLKGNTTVTADATASPTGIVHASKIFSNSTLSTHVIQSELLGGVGTFTLSIFAKASELKYIELVSNNPASGQFFDLENGVKLASSGTAPISSSITSFGNGWYKCSITQVLTSTTRLNVFLSEDGITRTYQGDGTSGIYIWGAQLEEQSYATSYIPTNGANATRVAETLSKTGLGNYINSSEGVLYAEIKQLDESGVFRLIQLTDGTQNNRIVIYFNVTNGFVSTFINYNNVEQYNYISSTNASEFTKIAIIYSANKVATFINGVKVDEQLSSINTPLNLSKLDFSGSGSSFFYGKVKDLRVYNQALTDVQLQTLTTL